MVSRAVAREIPIRFEARVNRSGGLRGRAARPTRARLAGAARDAHLRRHIFGLLFRHRCRRRDTRCAPLTTRACGTATGNSVFRTSRMCFHADVADDLRK